MDLIAFEREMRAVGGAEAPRPFLCDGSPFDCQVFLIGINPATDIPLWPYWSAEYGCDKQAWLKAYLKKRNQYGPTRARIERLLKSLAPVRALETNIFQRHSPRESHLGTEHKKTEVFDFLLKRMAPRVVFVYGRSAVAHLQRLTSARIEYDVFTTVRYQEVAFDLFAGHHLAYQWSYKKVEELGRALQARCQLLSGEPRRTLCCS